MANIQLSESGYHKSCDELLQLSNELIGISSSAISKYDALQETNAAFNTAFKDIFTDVRIDVNRSCSIDQINELYRLILDLFVTYGTLLTNTANSLKGMADALMDADALSSLLVQQAGDIAGGVDAGNTAAPSTGGSNGGGGSAEPAVHGGTSGTF